MVIKNKNSLLEEYVTYKQNSCDDLFWPELSHFFSLKSFIFNFFFLCGGVRGVGWEVASGPLPALPTSLCAYGHIISKEVKKSEMRVLLFKQVCINKSWWKNGRIIILWVWQYIYFKHTESLFHSFLLFLTVILSELLDIERNKLLLVSHPSYVPFFLFVSSAKIGKFLN